MTGFVIQLPACRFEAIAIVLSATTVLSAVSPTSEDLAKQDSWVAVKFQGSPKNVPWKSGLIVLASHNPVQRNSHLGKPLNIEDRLFIRGLISHANSKILVQRPSPGKTFPAW